MPETIRVGGRVPETYDNLGCVLQELGMLAEAERSHREALKLSWAGSAHFSISAGSTASRVALVRLRRHIREALRSMPGERVGSGAPRQCARIGAGQRSAPIECGVKAKMLKPPALVWAGDACAAGCCAEPRPGGSDSHGL